MFLNQFVKTEEFKVLFEKHIIESGGTEGLLDGRKFVIVTGWSDIENLIDDVILMVENIDITMDEIIGEYLDDADGNFNRWGFNDEYISTSCCGKIVNVYPQCDGEKLDYTIKDGECTCKECLLKDYDGYLESITNVAKVGTFLTEEIMLKEGFIKYNNDPYQSGFHTGMDDDPKKVLELLQNQGKDVVFLISSTSQFYTEWDAWVKPVIYECCKCGAECELDGIDKHHKCYGCVSEEIADMMLEDHSLDVMVLEESLDNYVCDKCGHCHECCRCGGGRLI